MSQTRPCPLCGGGAPDVERYPRALCQACTARAVDGEGRPVHGAHLALSGGFQAYVTLADGSTEPDETVSHTHRVWVDGHPCTMDEARFGGIVVEALGD